MSTNPESEIVFPVAELPEGEFAPARPLDDPTWKQIDPWTDPLADRGAYGVSSMKKRITTEHGPTIHFEGGNVESGGRALIYEEATLTNYTIACRAQLLSLNLPDMGTHRLDDGHGLTTAMAGLVARMQTLRRYYTFCIEGRDRLMLYRRDDTDWHVLNWRRVELPDHPISLSLTVEGNRLCATCPDLEIEMIAIDNAFETGKAGYRSIGESQMTALRLKTTADQAAVNAESIRAFKAEVARLGKDIPDAIPVKTLDLGDDLLIVCSNFVHADRTDFLWKTPKGIEARNWSGDVLWRHDAHPKAYGQYVQHQLGPVQFDGSRRLYLLVGERGTEDKIEPGGTPADCPVADEILILNGASGETLVRTELPLDPPSPGALTRWDFSADVGFGNADGEPDFMIRQWRRYIGNGGIDLWMYDRTGKLLWQRQTSTVYGHHWAVHWADFNRDGVCEIIAGGSCLDAQGEPLWTYGGHDEIERYDGAGSHTGHYDSVMVQSPDDWATTDPLLVYVVGGAGIQIADAVTGKTKAIYRVGHAQGGEWVNVRPDLPGREVLVHTRWGTYGILTLISGTGEKLWSIQPDYVGEHCHAVQWKAEGPQHIWVNTSEAGMGLYNGYGKLVKPLSALRKTFAGKTRHQIRAYSLLRRPGGRHWLALEEGSKLHLFKPEDDTTTLED